MLRLLRADDAHGRAQSHGGGHARHSWIAFGGQGCTVDPAERGRWMPRRWAPPSTCRSTGWFRRPSPTPLKHAGDGPTRLHVADGDDGITIEVTSPPGRPRRRDPRRRPTGAGQGLIGMRERVEMFGGTLHAGPGPDGSFEIRALIPHEAET